MQCMKCGREIAVGSVFCQSCLGDMEKYPVKPGTVVQIPQRPAASSKRPEKRQATIKQQLATALKTIRVLSFVLTLTIALLIGVSALAVSLFLEQEEKPLPGQNYSTVESTGPAAPTDPSTRREPEDVSRETFRTRR